MRQAAGEALAALDEIGALAASPEKLRAANQAEDAAVRERAAAALGWAADTEAAAGELTALLWDRDPAVQRAALRASGRSADPRLLPQVASHLAMPEFREAAAQALLRVGEPALPTLAAAYLRSAGDAELRLEILGLEEQIGGSGLRESLRARLMDPDPAVRRRVIAALARCPPKEAGDAERATVFAMIEEAAATTAWNLAAWLDLAEDSELAALRQTLEAENRRQAAAVFRLLSLLYESATLARIQEALQAEERERQVYALEMLDVLLPVELKPLVLPLVEDSPPPQKLRRLAASFPQARLDGRQRLEAIVHRDPALLGLRAKACAIRALGRSPSELSEMLLVGLFHPDALLRRLSTIEICRLRPADWRRYVERLPAAERSELLASVTGDAPDQTAAEVLDKVLALAAVEELADLGWRPLLALAIETEEVELAAGTRVPAAGDAEGSLYVLGPDTGAGGETTALVRWPQRPPVEVRGARRALRLDGDFLAARMARSPDLLEAVFRLAAGRRAAAARAPATPGHSGAMDEQL